MKRLIAIVAMLVFSGAGVTAQQTPSTQTPSQDPMPQAQADRSNAQQSARGFEGKIGRSAHPARSLDEDCL
jgi:hypothetical protein